MEKDKINLLIVDDEEQFLEATRKRLEIRGFNVFCVNRGNKALELAGKQPIDIALVDLKMPASTEGIRTGRVKGGEGQRRVPPERPRPIGASS